CGSGRSGVPYTSFEMVARPTLDTAVAASLLGYGEGVGLGKLLKSVIDIDIKKGHARTNWSARPLPEQLIEYAHADVIYLVELGKTLLEKLEKQNRRAWGLELSSKWEDPSNYDVAPEDIAQKLAKSGRIDKRGYSALIELVRWREDRVKAVNVPRRWIADDTVLMDLAHVRPKDMEHLAQFRGLNKGELKSSGEAILAALKRASESEDLVLPKTPKSPIPTAEEMQVLDLLKCYVGILADRHHLTDRHLIASAQYLPLIRTPAATSDDLVRAGILSSAAAALAGEELIAMVRGKRALSVDGSQIKIVEIAEAKK
ncbi:MAG: HRDC domain-containing protein, partial [Bdellovibrionota bacterium]